MKKLVQVSLLLVFIFMLLQAVSGGTFVRADKLVSYENDKYAAAPSGQSVQAPICASSHLVYCTRTNVRWNS
jgi:hypothetical protein